MRRQRRQRAERRVPGTRARGPAPEPGRLERHLAAAFGVLALLAAVAAAPHALDFAQLRARQAPFLLETVQVHGLGRLEAGEVVATLALEPGIPLVDLAPRELEARLAEHPWIAGATVVRWPPDALRVRIQERVPLAVAPVEGDAALHAVDETGTAFAPATPEDVARLVAIGLASPPVMGEPDPRLMEALALAAALRARGLEVPRRVTLGLPERERSAEIRLRGLRPAIWLERAEPGPQLDRLALLLAAHVEKTVDAQLIDLRFGDRIVLREGP